jgi:adenylylsulfate kinase
MVIWLIGISGAGKTTLGKKLKAYWDAKNQKSFLIDGDIVRDFYDNDLGFSQEDRRANIKRILFSAYVLEQNGIIPIVCNISPFEDLRAFARQKFNDYHEIYLRKDIHKALQNDVKGIYQKHLSQTSLVGIDLVFEEPTQSDLVLNVDDEDVETSFQSIIRYLEEKVKTK